ncbi:zinc protease [Bacteroidia bacterium]|nr:zinc protease [Bacteroidia bacterium]
MEKKFQDKELGTVILRTNPRAVRYTLRVKDGAVIATMPARGSESTLLRFIRENTAKLKELLQRPAPSTPKLDETTKLHANTFELHIYRTEREGFYMRLGEGFLHIACPQATDFSDERVQTLLRSYLERALRHEAKRILPVRLQTLAAQHGFTYVGLRIADTKSRWGSCSTQRRINLSLSLMLLPNHLLDYVILHELCHTVEMNHSARFWSLMNRVTNNSALSLRKELKGYTTRLF